MADGGVIALFGFRYQMLRAMEEILVLHRGDPGGDWAVEVEHATNDKVDYAVYREGQLTRAVQVKASLPGSSTRLSIKGEAGVAKILSDLAKAFPAAPEVALVSNRQGPWDDINCWVTEHQPASGPRLRAYRDFLTLEQAEQSVIVLLRDSRMTSQLPSDPSTISALAAILEAQLWRLGSQELAATDQGHRWLDGKEIQKLLGLHDQELAATVGELSWAMKWKEPAGRAVARPDALSFLAYELSSTDLATGSVRRAALTGFGGLGKSMAAANWADEHRGLYSMVLWLTGTNAVTIEAEVRQLLVAKYDTDAVTWSVPELQKNLCEWLQTTPRSWLLVLDDAQSVDVVNGWIPASGFGHVLITTRDSAWPISHTSSFEVGRMDNDELQAMVAVRLGAKDLSPGDLNQLVLLTDRWALAVDMVLAWLTRNHHTLADLASFDLGMSRQRLLDEPDLVPVGYPEPVVAIILDALASLQAERPEAWALLQGTVALGGESVPVAMASDHTNDSLDDLLKRDQLVTQLRGRSVASPISYGDPRLRQWNHRLNVHDLIAQLLVHLDSVSADRWGTLLKRLTDVVENAAEQHEFTLVLSLGSVISAVDNAVLTGAPFSIEYLTLLGNTAVVLTASGRLDEAANRLQYERTLARQQASLLPQAESRPVEWFGLLATVQLAAVLNRLDRYGEALSLLETAVPMINSFPGEVNPDKLSNVLELAIDVLESMRSPELFARRNTVLDRAQSGVVSASSSPLRAAEASLRLDDLAVARTICEKALAATPLPMEKVDLYGTLAETWAVQDIRKSDSLLSLAQITAEAEDIDLELPLSNLQNTIHRRIIHLLGLDHETLRRGLSTYQSWFQVDSLMPPATQCRTWRHATMSLFSRAWRELTEHPQDAASAVSAVVEKFQNIPSTVSPNEILGLRFMLWGTQFTNACSVMESLDPVEQCARSGSKIFIEVSQKMWDKLPNLIVELATAGRPLVAGNRFGPFVLIEVGTWGLTLKTSDFDPFAQVEGAAAICLVQRGAIRTSLHSVDVSAVLELGYIPNLQANDEIDAFMNDYESA